MKDYSKEKNAEKARRQDERGKKETRRVRTSVYVSASRPSRGEEAGLRTEYRIEGRDMTEMRRE